MTDPLVRVENLTKTYQDGKQEITALAGINLDIFAKDFLALSGPSGSGKTTLLNLIGALDRPDRGEIRIEGISLSGMNFDQLTLLRRNKIGFIFQAFNLIPVMTALENTAFTMSLQKVDKREREARSREALAAVGLAGYEHRFSNQLSGGQQQRVAVARAIAARPALILADEPTANLDSRNANELLDLMQRLNEEQGITFVFSTHDHRIMERAHRIVPMKDGRITKELHAGEEPSA